MLFSALTEGIGIALCSNLSDWVERSSLPILSLV
ncbi:MAG: hypothetical protein RLZZ184_3951 [Cyanobacteriota bacterium]|jgi:hypothetical protein